MQERSEAEQRTIWPCLNVATWRRERSDRAIQQIRLNSTAFYSIPAIRSKGSTSVLSTRKIRPIYSHPTCRGERTSLSFLCQKRGTFLEAPQPQYSRETGAEFHQISLNFGTIWSDPNRWKARRWNYPSALGGSQAISLGCYLCRSSRPQ